MKLEEEEVEEPLILRFEYTIVMVYLPFLHRWKGLIMDEVMFPSLNKSCNHDMKLYEPIDSGDWMYYYNVQNELL